MIKVYQYGCLPPAELPDAAEEQLRLANRFWNKLVEIDRETREENQKIWSSEEPVRTLEEKIAALVAQQKSLREETKAAKSSARRATVPKERREQIRALDVEVKALRAQLKEVKAEVKPLIAAQQQALFDAQKAKIKAARQDFAAQGLYWGTYNERAASFRIGAQRAYKTRASSDQTKNTRQGAPSDTKNSQASRGQLRFRRFDGSGGWTVQIQTESGKEPATVADLMNPTSRIRNLVRVDPVDFSNWDSIPRSERRKRARTTLHLRVASEGREPVWIHLPMIMHRPIPAEASVKLIRLKREKASRSWRYSVTFTVDEPAQPKPDARFALAVDLGWRKIGGEIRTGVWVGEDDPLREGPDQEIRVPERIAGGFAQVDRIKSHRDNHFNVAVAALKTWLAAQEKIPDWLAEDTQYLPQWRSHTRLLNLIQKWTTNRVDGDAEIVEKLTAWKKREWHLQDFEVHLRDRLTRARREIYRIEAAKLAKRYATLILEDLDLRDLAKRPNAEDGDTWVEQRSRSNRTLASPGVLREALANAFASRGREVLLVDAANTTRIHLRCGNRVEGEDFAASVRVFCPHCQEEFDQDYNACRNLLGVSREPEAVLV